jgi:hypothetical protein
MHAYSAGTLISSIAQNLLAAKQCLHSQEPDLPDKGTLARHVGPLDDLQV